MRHTHLPLKQRQPKRARGATMLMLWGALTSPSHCEEAAPCDSHGAAAASAAALLLSAVLARLNPAFLFFFFFLRLITFVQVRWEEAKKQTKSKHRVLSVKLKVLSRTNGRNGYNGLNASESEKATASNQFRG